MPIPVLTPQEIAQLTKEKAAAEAASATFANAVAGQTARAQELALVDSGFKKFFDYYNDDIIGKYDLERRWLNGYTLTSPVTEADVIDCASLGGGRLQPALPVTDVIRIAQFDGTPFTVNADNEIQRIADQVPVETAVVSGYGGVAPAITIVTDSVLTASSTTLVLKDPAATFSLGINNVYTVVDGSNLIVFKVLSFNMQVAPVPPPYVADLTIEVLVPPAGSIAAGQPLGVFTGFNNTERTNKVASNPQYQPLMNYFVTELNLRINFRIATLNQQLTALNAQLDPGGTAETNTATLNVNASKTYLTNYIITTDISNTGLTALANERTGRSTQITTRVAQIISAYTGRTKNYYNERYNLANNRANTSRGSLRLQKNAEQVAAASGGFAATLTSQAGAIGGLIP